MFKTTVLSVSALCVATVLAASPVVQLNSVAMTQETALDNLIFSAVRLENTGRISVSTADDVFCRSGEHGLWRIVFANGIAMSAADFETNGVLGGVFRRDTGTNGRHFVWTSPQTDVTVTTEVLPGGAVDIHATVSVRGDVAVRDFELPARLRFPVEQVGRFVYPGRGNYGLGMAFNAKFFARELSYRVKYPTLVSDFAQLETAAGARVSVYGLRPRPPHEPWNNPLPFVPGWTAVGGDTAGGWYDHAFGVWVRGGDTWKSPKVRLAPNLSLDAAVADYARGNSIIRTLADKVPDSARLNQFKKAPLYLVTDIAAYTKTLNDAYRLIPECPAPTLFHLTTYLKGGFDKEYPDHLPPNPKFGTAEDLKKLFELAHSKRHLVCPYTNPTWWCDDPRGPTFQKWGDGVLAVKQDGSHYHENYNGCEGWVQTYFHSGSLEGNRRTIRQFTEEYPADLIFQDQAGARDWIYDFNPASPSPAAYSEGIIAMAEEDSLRSLIATEDGWDGLVNTDLAFMGCTWRIVPVKTAPAWLQMFKEEFPADTWEIEPVMTRLAHDKALFYMHNLGSFVTDDRTLAWTLGIGFNLSFSSCAAAFKRDPAMKEWYAWLHLLQSRVVSRIAGQKVLAFKHDRAPLFERGGDPARRDDDGVITARYGDVEVVVNLGDVPRVVNGKRLAPYGFDVTAPGLHAAKLEGDVPFVVAEGQHWTFAPDPAPLPVTTRETVPPSERSGVKPSIAVLDVGPWLSPGHVGGCASVHDWVQALETSVLVRTYGLAVEKLPDVAALRVATQQGPHVFFAIVNPYGEAFPQEGQGCWRDVLASVRDYVRAGGIWIETGGASFYSAVNCVDGKCVCERLMTDGMDFLGLQYGTFGGVNEKPVPLHLSTGADKWLSPYTRALVEGKTVLVNRAAGDSLSQAVCPLLEDENGRVWFGGYRLGGWGTLWRFGGLGVDRELALAVVPDVLLHQYTYLPTPIPANRVPRLRINGHTNERINKGASQL